MVQDAKKVASNIRDQPSIGKWRDSNQKLLDSVGKVRKAVAGPEPIPDVSALNLSRTLLRGKHVFHFVFNFVFWCRCSTAPAFARWRTSPTQTTTS